MRIFAVLLLTFPLFAADSFITPEEYAQQLYHNPRGIGCHHCHGEAGEGKIVATYKQKKETRVFEGPAIDKVPFETFSRALNSRVRGMPRYFLTGTEIRALYAYLHHETKPTSAKEPRASR